MVRSRNDVPTVEEVGARFEVGGGTDRDGRQSPMSYGRPQSKWRAEMA